MDLTELIASRAHRNLRRLENYQKTADFETLTDFSEIPQRQSDEVIIGIYRNIPGGKSDTIIVTTQGLHIYTGGEWQRVDYYSIDQIETPPTETKKIVSQLVIHLKSKETVIIPIRGGKDGTRDAWSFLTFLMRVIEDIKDFDSQN